MTKLFFVGDSITAGAWDDKGGWANRLIGKVMEKSIDSSYKYATFYCLPYNLGISGNTTTDVLLRLESEIEARIKEDQAIEIIFSIGVNDALLKVKEQENLTPLLIFESNVKRLIKKARKVADRVSFIGLLPVVDHILNPLPWDDTLAYRNQDVKAYDDALEKACHEYKVRFLPLFEIMSNREDYESLLQDGIHPNTKGHEVLSDIIGKFLFEGGFIGYHS